MDHAQVVTVGAGGAGVSLALSQAAVLLGLEDNLAGAFPRHLEGFFRRDL